MVTMDYLYNFRSVALVFGATGHPFTQSHPASDRVNLGQQDPGQHDV